MEAPHGSTSTASSSTGQRKRKHNEDNFFACVGLPLADTSLREVLARWEKNPSIATNSRWRSSNLRFQNLVDCLVEEQVEVTDGKVTLYTTNLQKYVDVLREKKPDYINFLKKIYWKSNVVDLKVLMV